jgi:hypothetical protein
MRPSNRQLSEHNFPARARPDGDFSNQSGRTGNNKARSNVLLCTRSDEMCDLGRAVEMETAHAFLDQAIGIRNSLVLAQMLRPGRDVESLDDASFVGGILEYAPAIGTVAASFISELFNDLQELLPILRTNAVFDCDEDWPSVVIDRVGRERRRPMHGGRQVDTSPSL